MPVAQTTFSEVHKPGLEGQIATMWGGNTNRETRIVETAAGIAFGRAVSAGAAVKGCIVGGTLAGLLGLTIRDITLVPLVGQAVDLYQRYQNAGVMDSGDMWVIAVNGATINTVASFDAVTGQLNPAANGIDIPGSRWLTAASAGALALLRLTVNNPGAPPAA